MVYLLSVKMSLQYDLRFHQYRDALDFIQNEAKSITCGLIFKAVSQILMLYSRISEILRLRRLQRMLPASAEATETNLRVGGSDDGSASPTAMPPPSALAGPSRLNGGGGGRLLPMLHHQRFVSLSHFKCNLCLKNRFERLRDSTRAAGRGACA